MKTNYFFLSVACATCMLFSAQKATAEAPYIYEGFDYALGTVTSPENGFIGGTGWGPGRSWDPYGGVMDSETNGVTDAAPLTVAGLIQTPRHLNGFAQYVSCISRMINNHWQFGAYNEYLVNGRLGKPLTTLWYSVILRPQNNKKTCSLALSNTGDLKFAMRVGAFGGSFWGIQVGSGTEVATAEVLSTVPIVNNEAKFLVFKVEYAATVGGTITLYVDPTPGTEPTVASATLTTATDITFEKINLFSGGTMGDMAADEIRVATSYALVAPSTGGATGISKNVVENARVYSKNNQIIADLSAVKGASTVSIIDTKGSVIKTIQNAGSEMLTISVANKGVYMVRVQNAGKVSTVKVVL